MRNEEFGCRPERMKVPHSRAYGFLGAVGDDDEDGLRAGRALGEGREPGEGLQVGPLCVVHDEDEWAMNLGEPYDQGVEAVLDALRVGVLLTGRCYTERGADDLVLIPQQLPRVHGLAVRPAHREGRLEQVPYDMERNGSDGLAAPGGPHRAASRREPTHLGQQRRLPDSGGAPVDEDATGGRRTAQRVHRVCRRGEFGFALQQREGDLVLRPVHRQPSPFSTILEHRGR